MQNKGAISLFAILLVIVCLFELSFTWVAGGIEKDAKAFAGGDIAKERQYLDSIAGEPVYNILLKNYTYREVKERELNLGLDLKGGMNVTLEVSVPDVVRSISNNSQDSTFLKVFNQANERYKTSSGDFISIFSDVLKQVSPDAQLSSPAFFGNKDMKDLVNATMSNEEILDVIREKVESSIDNSYIVLRNRIDKFGVTQPNIQRLESSGRILVELPGVQDPDRVRKLLQGAAKLEFWETYDNKEVFNYLDAANTKLKSLNAISNGTVDTTASASIQDAVGDTTAKDTTASELSLKEKLALNDTSATSDTSDAAQFANFAKENPLFAVLQPFINQTEEGNFFIPGPVVGLAAMKDTSKVTEILGRQQIKTIFPKDLKFMWSVKPYDDKGSAFQLIAIKVPATGKPKLTGENVSNARKTFGQLNNKPEINMIMTGEGAGIWKKLTGDNVGNSIAIVLDDYVYSFPTVQGEIAGGSSSITGNFTIKEADDLANILNSGKMDAPARIVEEAVVGPSLGKEAITAGILSALAGLLLVFVFMAFYYSGGGLVADIAVLANLFFLMGVMASLGAVLTLPGIAGIVLTIGMSVDANVLIYERIREELVAGKGYRLAIADGYKNAYSAIIDSNVTTLLTGIILYTFGTGPIQGFATTLVIGILTSLFSAIFVTRLILEFFASRKKELKFSIPATSNVLKNTNYNFIAGRKKYYTISGAIVLIGLASILFKGFGYGVDFKGGRSYVVRFDQTAPTEKARTLLFESFGQAPDVKTFGSSNQLRITTSYLIDDYSETADSTVAGIVLSKLTEVTGTAPEIVSSQKVGPTVASDIKRSATLAIIFSLIVMFFYLLIRFRKWYFGAAAVAGLSFTVIVVLAIFSLLNGILPFSLDVDQAFIAAILTVVGYSINDTVIVFDRIREYLGMYSSKKEDIAEVINTALNNTLSRTIVTSLSTLLVLVILFVFGGEVIRGFSFAMLIGIIVGTFASLFVASPIVVDLTKRFVKENQEPTKES